jgi:hypothetical protein
VFFIFGLPPGTYATVKLFVFIRTVKQVIRTNHRIPCPVCLFPIHEFDTPEDQPICPECGIQTNSDEAKTAWMKFRGIRRVVKKLEEENR